MSRHLDLCRIVLKPLALAAARRVGLTMLTSLLWEMPRPYVSWWYPLGPWSTEQPARCKATCRMMTREMMAYKTSISMLKSWFISNGKTMAGDHRWINQTKSKSRWPLRLEDVEWTCESVSLPSPNDIPQYYHVPGHRSCDIMMNWW